MSRIAVYVDCSNLYYTVKETHKGSPNYKKYIEYIKAYMGDPVIMKAFGAQKENEANKFINALRSIGFTTKWKRAVVYENNVPQNTRPSCTADWDIGIVTDIYRNIDEFDTLILGSGDGDFVDMVELLRDLGKSVVIFACKPSHKLKKKASTCVEITSDMVIG